MLRQQLIGIISLSLPLIIAYNIQPALVMSVLGIIISSLLVGFYIAYCAYKQLQTLEKTLQFSPSGSYKDFFENLISECNINPKDVTLKYAFTNETIAMTAGKTVVIDPIVWHDVDHDEQAVQVQNIFKHHIERTLSSQAKERIAAIRNHLTPQAQRFIFKHELAHVMYNFSHKKLIVIFLLGTISAYVGIFAAQCLLSFHPLLAVFAGMFIGGIMDLLLTHLSNFFWKLHEEKKADAFAVQYSNQEDIQAAADFFEQYQHIVDKYKDGQTYFSLPLSMTAGYQDGATRANYIFELLAHKKK